MSEIKISPSLLAVDMASMGEAIRRVETCVDMLHFDVMDGHFVPNISFGVPVLAGLNKFSDITMDIHLMIEHPLLYIEKFAEAGADIITVHIEAPDNALECVRLIKSLGKAAGIALNPDTAPSRIAHLADEVDMVLQMTVFPGFGGQSMVASALDNIKTIRDMIGGKDLQVDGGIHIGNCAELVELGANVIVSGTGIFGQPDPAEAAKVLRARCKEAQV